MAFLKPQELLMFYGLVLMICGALAYNGSGRKREAYSALIVGNGGALLTFLVAAGVGSGPIQRGESNYKLRMASVHFALLYPLVLAAALSWRLYKAWGVPQKAYVIPYFVVMIAASVAVVAGIAAQKPKPAKSTQESKAQEEKAQ